MSATVGYSDDKEMFKLQTFKVLDLSCVIANLVLFLH